MSAVMEQQQQSLADLRGLVYVEPTHRELVEYRQDIFHYMSLHFFQKFTAKDINETVGRKERFRLHHTTGALGDLLIKGLIISEGDLFKCKSAADQIAENTLHGPLKKVVKAPPEGDTIAKAEARLKAMSPEQRSAFYPWVKPYMETDELTPVIRRELATPKTMLEMVNQLGMFHNTLTYHLNKLERAGLVEDKDGKWSACEPKPKSEIPVQKKARRKSPKGDQPAPAPQKIRVRPRIKCQGAHKVLDEIRNMTNEQITARWPWRQFTDKGFPKRMSDEKVRALVLGALADGPKYMMELTMATGMGHLSHQLSKLENAGDIKRASKFSKWELAKKPAPVAQQPLPLAPPLEGQAKLVMTPVSVPGAVEVSYGSPIAGLARRPDDDDDLAALKAELAPKPKGIARLKSKLFLLDHLATTVQEGGHQWTLLREVAEDLKRAA